MKKVTKYGYLILLASLLALPFSTNAMARGHGGVYFSGGVYGAPYYYPYPPYYPPYPYYAYPAPAYVYAPPVPYGYVPAPPPAPVVVPAPVVAAPAYGAIGIRIH